MWIKIIIVLCNLDGICIECCKGFRVFDILCSMGEVLVYVCLIRRVFECCGFVIGSWVLILDVVKDSVIRDLGSFGREMFLCFCVMIVMNFERFLCLRRELIGFVRVLERILRVVICVGYV